MRNLFEATLKYAKETEEGLLKVVSERYIVEAVNHTDAETTMTKLFTESIRGDFRVSKLTQVELSDIVNEEGPDHFWKVKYSWIGTSDSGKEKKITEYILINAPDISAAINGVSESLSGPAANIAGIRIKIEAAALSPVLEVFLQEEDPDHGFGDDIDDDGFFN